MSNAVIEFAKDHPLATGAAAVGFIVVIMLLSGGGSADEPASTQGSAGVAAYYAAVANQTQAGAAVQIAEVQANATTNQTLIAATYGLEREKVGAQVANHAADLGSTVAYEQIQAQKYGIWAAKEVADNNVNLQNSALHSGEIVAGINAHRDIKVAKASGPSTGQDIAGVIGSIGSAAKSILPFF